MGWSDRLQEAAYTSPGGRRVTFDYEDVSREITKRTVEFEFSNVEGAYVQENGIGARKYPLRCFFAGDDHDVRATVFEACLIARGAGRLEHPLYGTFDVVPAGTITRRDDLKSAANQSVIEVTFVTTLGTVYPQSQTNARSEILAALGVDTGGGFVSAASEQFADSTKLTSTVEKETMKATIRRALKLVSAELDAVASESTAVSRAFDDRVDAVMNGLDVLIGDPLELAQQIAGLVTLPATSTASVLSRLEGFAVLATRLLASNAGRPGVALAAGSSLPRRRQLVSNDFHGVDLFAMSAMSGSVRSVVENKFDTRPAAMSAAVALLAQFDAIVAWRDLAFGDLAEVDTGAAYRALQSATAIASGYLVQVSFSLVPERRIVLDRPRTIIDVAAEVYGSVDDRLDFLIATNELTGSEILELPAGRMISYYA